MKSLLEYKKANKRGQTINLISGTVMGLMVLFFLIFAVLFGISALNPGTFFDSGTASDNSSKAAVEGFQGNITEGISQFGAKLPTVFLILGVVLAIAAIVILVLYVKRMQQSGGSGGGGL